MPVLGYKSKAILATCHPLLQKLLTKAIERADFGVLCGNRGEKEQNDAYKNGFSKLKFGESLHNTTPSEAVDLAPYYADSPIMRWGTIQEYNASEFLRTKYHSFDEYKQSVFDEYKRLARVIFEVAAELGIKIRWGGDWNMNGRTDDERFLDLCHFELVKNEQQQ